MKFKYICIVLLIISNSLFADHYYGKIVIKLNDLNALKKNTEFDLYLSEIVGEYQFETLIDKNLLLSLNNRKNDFSMQNSGIESDLERIFLINFDEQIDVKLLASKLNNLNSVEYAEPLFKRNITFFANDTLIHEQYYLTNTDTYKAWEYLDSLGVLQELIQTEILIGIVDTGIDLDHIELNEMIYRNNAEIVNGIDDDGNGFIDDIHGWDFVSDSASGYDNMPYPGHPHGTHVAGVVSAKHNNEAGIAGIGINMKLLPVKIGGDSRFNTSVENSFDGILYAGLMGCDIINCSWGGSSRSQAEQEIVNHVTAMGSLIIAAAGNDGKFMPQYPASYDNVISVAATDYTDQPTNFTNMHGSVDVSAPGFQIISTIPNNDYDTWNGTSMASPIATAVAGWLKRRFPKDNPVEIGEKLKSSSKRIETLNNFFPGMMGSGIVNTMKIFTDSNFYSIEIFDSEIINLNNNKYFRFGDQVEINFKVRNKLDDLSNVSITAYEPLVKYLEFSRRTAQLGNMKSGEKKEILNQIKFEIIDERSFDRIINPIISISSDEGYRYFHALSLVINPTYNIYDNNYISATFNSIGNIAYNDFPGNTQGEGVQYKGSKSLLFEGAFMAAIPGKLNDVARLRNSQSRDFEFDNIISKEQKDNRLYGKANFFNIVDSNYIGLNIEQNIIQPNTDELGNVVYIQYKISNNSGEFIDSLFAGLFLDWDIGNSGQNDFAYIDKNKFAGIMENTETDTLPHCSLVLLNHRDKVNFYAISNPGSDTTTFSIYNGFSTTEKWKALSNGIAREKSDTTDASFVISAGPISIRQNDTLLLNFALVINDDRYKLDGSINEAINNAANYIEMHPFANIENRSKIINIFPNPVNNKFKADIFIDEDIDDKYKIILYDDLGREVRIINDLKSSINRLELSVENLSQGNYYLSLNKYESIIDSKIIKVIKE